MQDRLVQGVGAGRGDGEDRRRGVQPDALGDARNHPAQALEIEIDRAQAVAPRPQIHRGIDVEWNPGPGVGIGAVDQDHHAVLRCSE